MNELPADHGDRLLAAERDRAEMGYVLGCVVRDLDNPLPDGGGQNVNALRREMRRLGVVVRRVLIELRGDDRDVPGTDNSSSAQDSEANGEKAPEGASPEAQDEAASNAAREVIRRALALRQVRETLDPKAEGSLNPADLVALAEWVLSGDAARAMELHGFEQTHITERERIRAAGQ